MTGARVKKFGVVPADTIVAHLIPMLRRLDTDQFVSMIIQCVENFHFNMEAVKDPKTRIDAKCQAWQYAQAFRAVCKHFGWFCQERKRPVNWMEDNYYANKNTK